MGTKRRWIAAGIAAAAIALAVLGLAECAALLLLAAMIGCGLVILDAEIVRSRAKCQRDHELRRPWGDSPPCSCPDKRD